MRKKKEVGRRKKEEGKRKKEDGRKNAKLERENSVASGQALSIKVVRKLMKVVRK